MPLFPEDTRQLIHLRALRRATRKPLQPANEACSCDAALDAPERLGDILNDGRTVMVPSRLLNGELLFEPPGAGNSAELAQAEGGGLPHQRIGIRQHHLQDCPYLPRPSAKLRDERAGSSLVTLFDGLNQLRANL
ncbi:hypothetical protein [Vitiosangium sp. GDMCC 1.1324]|uniref:hypothetical protein n=1 Tax=Vitiosangium sp. (strain GDMCC 1.1324) TaxID=2138576 RepID=UPI0011B57474|nr:hypothetical protein [Vitiosangium sp. GDMCC 1.1324]